MKYFKKVDNILTIMNIYPGFTNNTGSAYKIN